MTTSTQLQMNNSLETELNVGFIIDLELEEKTINKPNFDQVLIETLDLAFSSIDKAYKQVIYHQLEKQYALSKEAIPSNIKQFSQAIEDLFGEAALILEIKIINILHNKVPNFKITTQKEEKLTFISYLENLQNYM